MRSALGIALVLAALLSASATAEAPAPRSGWYAGIGDGPLRIGFRAKADRRVGDFRGTYQAGVGDACERQLRVDLFDRVDSDGHFRVFNDLGATTNTVKGRFLTPATVRGRLIVEQGGTCIGHYEYGFFARRFQVGGGRATGIDPRDGLYVGSGDGAHVWFDLAGREADNGQVAVARGPCDGFNLPADGPDAVEPGARFRLQRTSGVSTMTVTGRFVDDRRVRGKAILETTHVACPGTYEFPFAARRFRDPG